MGRDGARWFKRSDTLAAMTSLDRYTFDLRGYLLFERALDQRTVARLREVIDDQRLPSPDDTIESQRFGSDGRLFSWDRTFCDLIDHPLALAALAHLIGAWVRLDHAYGITMRPGTSGLGLHGPAEPFDSSQYYLHRMGVMRCGLLTLSWSLSDGGPGEGGFGCIPGSHRAAEPLPPGAESLVVEVPQPAGSLLVSPKPCSPGTARASDGRCCTSIRRAARHGDLHPPRRPNWSRRCRRGSSAFSNHRRLGAGFLPCRT